MTKPRTRPPLHPRSIWDESALCEFLVKERVKTLHAKNIWKYLMRTKGSSIDSLKNIANFPLRLIEPLKANFCLFSSRVVNEQTSNDKSTTKLLVELQDGLRVETVIIRHGAITSRKPDGESRTTL